MAETFTYTIPTTITLSPVGDPVCAYGVSASPDASEIAHLEPEGAVNLILSAAGAMVHLAAENAHRCNMKPHHFEAMMHDALHGIVMETE